MRQKIFLELKNQTECQGQALEKEKEEKEAYGKIETQHPKFLVVQDTLHIGYIKGLANIY